MTSAFFIFINNFKNLTRAEKFENLSYKKLSLTQFNEVVSGIASMFNHKQAENQERTWKIFTTEKFCFLPSLRQQEQATKRPIAYLWTVVSTLCNGTNTVLKHHR